MPPDAAFADVSVITPAYRAVATIGRALQSVAAQTLKPRQAIVVDDGSEDGTFEAAMAMSGKMNGVDLKVVRQVNRGAGAARNRAVREANGAYIAFLDADDEWLPEKLARTMAHLEGSDNVLVSHDVRLAGGDGEYVFDCARHFEAAPDPFVSYFLRGYIATSTVAARRKALIAAGGFDERLASGQDYEMWLRLISAPGSRFHVFAGALTRNPVTENSISSHIDLRRRCAMAILHRHAGRLRGRGRGALLPVLLRALIIHAQAAMGHSSRRQYLRAARDCVVFPAGLVSAAWALATADRSSPGHPPEAGNPFVGTRRKVDLETTVAQERNRLWWEKMPMTYADWEAEHRLPKGPEDLKDLEARVLAGSPFLRERFDFAGYEGKRVLDLGCGSGIFSCLFAKSGASTTAVDLTKAAIDIARRTAQAHEADVAMARMDTEKLAFRPGSFDFIYSWGVLHHTSNMKAAFAEVARVLKPAGTGLVMVYHRHSVTYYLHGLFWLIVRGKAFQGHTLGTVQDFYTDGYYHRYLSRKEIVELLEDAGLGPHRIIVTQYQKKILPLVPGWLDRFLKSRFGMCLVAEFEKPES